MIRSAADSDTPAVVEVAVQSGLFGQHESGVIVELMTNYFVRTRAEGHVCLINVSGRDEPVAVAYYQPAPATDRTWELLLIAVRLDRQGQGHGAALLRRIEHDLRLGDQRLLLAETSGSPEFARTRAFYDRCGYTAEARVRDYYAAGEDMVVFRKDLRLDNADRTTAERAAGTTEPGRER